MAQIPDSFQILFLALLYKQKTMKMKKIILAITTGLFLFAGSVIAQDIPQSEVPSVILNKFKSEFPKAKDIEWETKADLYNVEFEIGRSADHEIWYDKSGNQVKHKEDISKNQLPKAVTNTLQKDFKGYRIDDVEKFTTGSTVSYKMELNSMTKDWDIEIDSNGKILKQKAD